MDAGTRSRKRKRFTGRSVTIVAGTGDNTETYTVHEEVLQERSTFFEAALHKCWKEGAGGKIELPEDDPSVVGAYLDWLYSKEIASIPQAEKIREAEVDDEFEFLAKLYVFGEKYQDNHFCNATMSATILRTGCKEQMADGDDERHPYPDAAAIDIIYKGTPRGSPMRAFVVDMCAKYGVSKWITDEDGNPDFLRELVQALLNARDPPDRLDEYPNRHEWFKTIKS